tara:strand:+ start:55 stop:357 length:303 start_codon:yes stop_codon:yes gene_type:complete
LFIVNALVEEFNPIFAPLLISSASIVNPPISPASALIVPSNEAFPPSIKNFSDANCPVSKLNSVPATVNPLPLPVVWFVDLIIPVDTTPPSILVVLAPPI